MPLVPQTTELLRDTCCLYLFDRDPVLGLTCNDGEFVCGWLRVHRQAQVLKHSLHRLLELLGALLAKKCGDFLLPLERVFESHDAVRQLRQVSLLKDV